LRLGVSAALLAALWAWLDGPAIAARVASADPRWLVPALLLTQAQTVASAARWRLTARALGHPVGLRRAVREYYVATLLNLTLPGGVAGEAARVARARNGAGWHAAAAPVAVERLAGQVALLALAAGGLALAPVTVGAPGWVSALGLAALGGLVLGARGLARPGGSRVRAALRRAWIENGAWRAQAALSLGVAGSYVAVFALCAAAVGEGLGPGAALALVPPTLLAMLLPLSVGGWGLREGAAAALWPLFGLGAEAGVAAAALYGLASLAGALPGAAWLWPARR
jgi:uncharacterized membrane protein YbhN (UPF0104 family)